MSVSEQDLEILEVWLDGELTDEQVEAFRVRLSAEPQLADAAARLRGDRDLRSRMWQTLEPSDAEIETLVNQVRRGVRKEDLVTSRLRMVSRISAVAASIAVVFMAGWISRSRLHVGDSPTQIIPVFTSIGANNGPLQLQPGSRVVVNNGPRSSNFATPVASVAVPRLVDPNTISRLAPNYEVRVIDPITGEVKLQRFLERLDDATQFANYVADFHPASETPRQFEASPQLNIQPANAIQDSHQ